MMSLITDVLIALLGGGIVGTVVGLITSRHARKAEGIKSYQDTIDMLMRTNSELIESRTQLMQELSELRAKTDLNDE
nr:MAG TPA: Protein of unknown function (DUF1043) [Caudoviricetes sp.]